MHGILPVCARAGILIGWEEVAYCCNLLLANSKLGSGSKEVGELKI